MVAQCIDARQASRVQTSSALHQTTPHVLHFPNVRSDVTRHRLRIFFRLGAPYRRGVGTIHNGKILSILTIICHRVVWNDRCYGSPYLPVLSFLSQR